MKSPDEIKKALECCFNATQCRDCPYYPTTCDRELVRDAREYIRQLEADNDRLTDEVCNAYNIQNEQLARIKQLEAERDALMQDMGKSCVSCKHSYLNTPGIDCCPYVEQCQDYAKWEWRGVQKEG